MWELLVLLWNDLGCPQLPGSLTACAICCMHCAHALSSWGLGTGLLVVMHLVGTPACVWLTR